MLKNITNHRKQNLRLFVWGIPFNQQLNWFLTCYFIIIPLPQASNPFSGRMLLTYSSCFTLCFSETCMPTSPWCSLLVLPLPTLPPTTPSYRLLWICTNLVLGQGSSQFSWPSCRLCMSGPQSFLAAKLCWGEVCLLILSEQ